MAVNCSVMSRQIHSTCFKSSNILRDFQTKIISGIVFCAAWVSRANVQLSVCFCRVNCVLRKLFAVDKESHLQKPLVPHYTIYRVTLDSVLIAKSTLVYHLMCRGPETVVCTQSKLEENGGITIDVMSVSKHRWNVKFTRLKEKSCTVWGEEGRNVDILGSHEHSL